MNHRPVIGIITSKVAEEAQRQLLQGILRKAREMDAEVVVISNIYNFQEYFAGTEVENKIYDLIVSPQLDGLILTAESFMNEQVRQYIYRRILASGLPVVVTGAVIPDMDCLNNNVSADFEEIAAHLTDVHHFTEFDFLTGPEEIETSYERITGFRRALARRGMTLPDTNVIYGDFWMNSGEALAKSYVSGERRMPQAVVCANDYMAYGVCDTLLANGINVPGQITVIGYEYVGERFYHYPILTTYLRNREALGEQAVSRLLSKILFIPETEKSVRGQLICGDTCTCGVNRIQLSQELTAVRRKQYYTTLNYEGNFEQQLTLCRSVEDYIHTMQEFVYLVRDVVGLYLCLYENWAAVDSPVTLKTNTDHAPMLCYRIISQTQPVSNEPQYFLRDQLSPEHLSGARERHFLYFAPIFFAGRELGHFILQYDKPDSYDPIFGDWLKIATNGLEALRMKNDIHALLECQNLSEHHDTATGLWNRSGFYTEMERALSKAKPEDSMILILLRTSVFADDNSIDGQTISVRMEVQIAESLKKVATGKHEFCAKLGDHLFCLGAVGNYDKGQEQFVHDQLRTLILHTSLYREHCGPDTLVSVFSRVPAQGAEPAKENRILLEKINSHIADISSVRSHPSYQDYRLLRRSIFSDPQKEWNAQDTCRNFHLSYGHFRATYKELFGISFHQDVIACRISLAKNLLLTTALSMQVIAYQCGYDDDKYFLRQFRQHTGCTPNAYRNQ